MDEESLDNVIDSDEDLRLNVSKRSKKLQVLSSDESDHIEALEDTTSNNSSRNIDVNVPYEVSGAGCHEVEENCESVVLCKNEDESLKFFDNTLIIHPLQCDEVDENCSGEGQTPKSILHLDKDIYDAEGSSDEELKDNSSSKFSSNYDCSDEPSKKKKKEKKGAPRKSRATKEDARETIHREAQRLVRESSISLPYHTPKQRTLKDFLTRRQSTPMVPLKAPVDRLSNVWKQLEEREKEVKTFYKSESSDDEPPIDESVSVTHDKCTPEILDKPVINEENFTKNLTNPESNPSNLENVVSHTDSVDDKKDFNLDIERPLISVTLKSDNCCRNSETVDGASEPNFFPDDNKLQLKDDTNHQNSCSKENTESNLNEAHSEPMFLLNTEDMITEEPVPKPVDNCENVSETLTKSLSEYLDKTNTKLPDENDDISDGKKVPCDKTTIESKLFIVPRLSADNGDIVELDAIDFKRKPGKVGLMHRLIKHMQLKPKPPVEVKLSVLNAEVDQDGNVINFVDDEVIVKTGVNESDSVKVKGSKFCALKESLRKSILATRSAIISKKIQQQKLYEDELCNNSYDKILSDNVKKDETLNNEEEEIESEEEDYEDDDDDEEDDDEILDEECDKEKKKQKNIFLDDEAEVTDDENSIADPEGEEKLAESSNEEEPDDRTSSSKTKDKRDFEVSMDLPKIGNEESQIPFSQDLMALCSGVFKTQPAAALDEASDVVSDLNSDIGSQDMFTQDSLRGNRVIDSDDEEIEKQSKLRTSRVLHISDDEDDEFTEKADVENINTNSENNDANSENSDSADEIEANDNNLLANSDSDGGSDNDDNTQVLDSNKRLEYNSEEEVIDSAAKFLDVEAELSGSEWGSADEDEQGLSDFEADEADTEKINERKLRSELERIHMKEMLMEDKREVRLLQELLLEDGELHSDGPKRQRLYRWSNDLSNFEGFVGLNNSDDDGQYEDEEVEDHSWRQVRIEREQFVSLQNSQVEEEEVNIDVKVSKHTGGFSRNNKPPTKDADIPPQPKPDIITSPDLKKQYSVVGRRGSFLGRNEKILAKLALASAGDDVAEHGISRVKRNMVFAVVSPPKNDPQDNQSDATVEKRKASEDMNKVSKKLKLHANSAAKRNFSILEKLRQID